MNSKRILITGSEGIIGKILSKNMEEYFIVKVDKLKTDQDSFICLDLSKRSLLSKIEYYLPLDCVVHLAADSNPKAEWDSVLINNIISTRNIFEFCVLNDIPKLVFASSNHVTGLYEKEINFPYVGRHNLIDTQKPVMPDGYYAVSKIFGENLGRFFSIQYNLNVICLRIGTVLKDDNPSVNPRYLSTWLSHRDLFQLIRLSIESHVKFGIYYGISNNTNKFWDTSNTIDELGYHPKDDASSYSNSNSY